MMPYIELRDLRAMIAEAEEKERRYEELRASKSPEAFEAMDALYGAVKAALDLEDRVFTQLARMLEQGY